VFRKRIKLFAKRMEIRNLSFDLSCSNLSDSDLSYLYDDFQTLTT
jgi:hypothetical protein